MPCPYCGSRADPVFVHGHSQCVECRINIEPCCGGVGDVERWLADRLADDIIAAEQHLNRPPGIIPDAVKLDTRALGDTATTATP